MFFGKSGSKRPSVRFERGNPAWRQGTQSMHQNVLWWRPCPEPFLCSPKAGLACVHPLCNNPIWETALFFFEHQNYSRQKLKNCPVKALCWGIRGNTCRNRKGKKWLMFNLANCITQSDQFWEVEDFNCTIWACRVIACKGSRGNVLLLSDSSNLQQGLRAKVWKTN